MIEENIEETGHQEQDYYEHYKFTADLGQQPVRIDKFLTDKIANISRNKIQNAASVNCILVNEKPVKSNYKIKPKDIISVIMPNPPKEFELIAQDLPLNIIYEDDDIIIVNKEAGMVVHPSYGHDTGTLVNALLHHIKLPSKSKDDTRPGLVHRIDKHTSGILVISKNEIALTKLAADFYNRDIERLYLALIWGDPKEDEGKITGNIGRSLKNRKIMSVFPDGEFGKHAVTHYKVLERFGYVTLIQCKLETGRTHQIRAHMKYINHPLFRDEEYGGHQILKGTTFTKYKQFVSNCFKLLPGQALHAKSLSFKHPRTGEYLTFDSELPDNFKEVINKWRNYAVSANKLK